MTANNGVLGLPGPEIPEPSHVVLNYGCSDWKRSSQRAADLYDSGKKLWEKKYLGDIESQLASSVTIKEFTVRRIDGSLVHIQNPNYGVENPIWLVAILLIQVHPHYCLGCPTSIFESTGNLLENSQKIPPKHIIARIYQNGGITPF